MKPQFISLRDELWNNICAKYGNEYPQVIMLQDVHDEWLLLFLVYHINKWDVPYESQIDVASMLYTIDKSLCAWFIVSHYTSDIESDILYGYYPSVNSCFQQEKDEILQLFPDIQPIIDNIYVYLNTSLSNKED